MTELKISSIVTLWILHAVLCEIAGHLLGPGQLEFSGLEIIRLDRKDDIGSTRVPFLLFLSSLLFLDLVKKLHKAVPGPVPALREVSTRWPSPDVEGFPNARSLPRHLPAVTHPRPGPACGPRPALSQTSPQSGG